MPVWLLLALLLAPVASWAHSLKLFVNVGERYLEGQTYFIGAGQASGISIKLLDDEGRTITQIISDADGHFRLPRPNRGETIIQAVLDEGHQDSLLLTPPKTKGDSLASNAPQDIAVVNDKLNRLQDSLDAYQRQLKVLDILGLIGLALGIVGISLWWRARHKKPPEQL
ncbi:hypothetical protein [Balneatrix alpica]|uniref:hypothetical protein n=1 Tax=Balneatrix alpica TaxID=75684 RepID=UPI002739B5E6|nr:hypothetical protein [Balneatrix alpica]